MVSKELAAVIPLPEFLETTSAGTLTIAERQRIVEQALLILEQNYAHLPLKVARYAVNPLQRLRLLLAKQGRAGEPEPEWRFHADLLAVFQSVRDLHTRYLLPPPFRRAGAFVPFLLKEFTENGRRRYLVARHTTDVLLPKEPAFRIGVEITHWNGVAVDRAVEVFATTMAGANPEARHARAVDQFTNRPLGSALPPDEEEVIIRYIREDGRPDEVRMPWKVVLPAEDAPDALAEAGALPLGIDVEAAQVARLRTLLYAPEFLAAEQSGRPVDTGPRGVDVSPEMSTVYQARTVNAAGLEFGHLRIRTFVIPPGQTLGDFVNEFIRLLDRMPPDGLLLDIRGNLGGAIQAAELCLQALTARPIEAEPAQFLSSQLNLRICRANPSLKPWLDSMEQAVESGAAYSAGIPFTTREDLERVPQAYFGPVVLLTDARCYSSADIFAAGFQDNRIGTVLGLDGNTGAGGGNVWRMPLLQGALPGDGESPYRLLPGGTDMTLTIRRMLRVGRNAGVPLEDFGVVPDERYQITRADLVGQEAGLMARTAGLLATGGRRRFEVALALAGGEVTATFRVEGIDRADISVDGRPRVSADLGGNPGPVTVPGAAGARRIRVEGYDGGRLVAARTFVTGEDGLAMRTTLA